VVSFVVSEPNEYRLLGAVLLVLMLFTHRGNIARLLKRAEHKV
jgi:hypothetical protein